MAVTAITGSDNRVANPAAPVARIKADVTIADGETEGTVAIGVNGRVIRALYDVPQLTGSVTVTVALLDEDATSLYSKATVAENAKTVDSAMVAAATPHGVVFAGTMTVKVTATGAQTGDQLVSVILYVI